METLSYSLAKSLNRDMLYLQMVEIWSRNSVAKRAKVGALIVKGNVIISDGYNGMPAGFHNACEHLNDNVLETNVEVLHAESNALMKLCKNGGGNANGSILYCSYSPCIDCAKQIVQAGIVQVHFTNFYRKLDGLILLLKAGIKCIYHAIPDVDFMQDDLSSLDKLETAQFDINNFAIVQHLHYRQLSDGYYMVKRQKLTTSYIIDTTFTDINSINVKHILNLSQDSIIGFVGENILDDAAYNSYTKLINLNCARGGVKQCNLDSLFAKVV